jgi:hypothetical protein
LVFHTPGVFGLALLPEAPELFLVIGVNVLRVNNSPKDAPEMGRQAVGLGSRLPALQPLKAFMKAIRLVSQRDPLG